MIFRLRIFHYFHFISLPFSPPLLLILHSISLSLIDIRHIIWFSPFHFRIIPFRHYFIYFSLLIILLIIFAIITPFRHWYAFIIDIFHWHASIIFRLADTLIFTPWSFLSDFHIAIFFHWHFSRFHWAAISLRYCHFLSILPHCHWYMRIDYAIDSHAPFH